jgi:excinuclease UvrABC ATPase subunit
LDEPSIGLHQRDNVRLIKALQQLRDSGNSVLVVEHDKDIMLASDYLIDIGPAAGFHGGRIVSSGHPNEVLTHNTLTAGYLNQTVLAGSRFSFHPCGFMRLGNCWLYGPMCLGRSATKCNIIL